MVKEKINLNELLHDVRLGLAEARLRLVSAGIEIPMALQNAVEENPLDKIRRLIQREKVHAKKEYLRGYHEAWASAVSKFKFLRDLPPPPDKLP